MIAPGRLTDGAVGGGSSTVLPPLNQGTTQMTEKKETPARVETVGTKRARLIDVLKRQNGASLNDMIAVTDWQAHTVRAALTGLKKTGHAITSEKVNGIRRYTIVESQPQ